VEAAVEARLEVPRPAVQVVEAVALAVARQARCRRCPALLRRVPALRPVELEEDRPLLPVALLRVAVVAAAHRLL
jgi:hypothetical protein